MSERPPMGRPRRFAEDILVRLTMLLPRDLMAELDRITDAIQEMNPDKRISKSDVIRAFLQRSVESWNGENL